MLDFDLATLYQIETRTLKQAVRRNLDRFPEDFMLLLNDNEIDLMVSQNVIPSKSYFGGAFPYAFTEQGVAMLSSILKSKIAIQANISIIRAFVEFRKLVFFHKDILSQIDQLKDILENHDVQLNQIYDAIENLLDDKIEKEEKNKPEPIGFKITVKTKDV